MFYTSLQDSTKVYTTLHNFTCLQHSTKTLHNSYTTLHNFHTLYNTFTKTSHNLKTLHNFTKLLHHKKKDKILQTLQHLAELYTTLHNYTQFYRTKHNSTQIYKRKNCPTLYQIIKTIQNFNNKRLHNTLQQQKVVHHSTNPCKHLQNFTQLLITSFLKVYTTLHNKKLYKLYKHSDNFTNHTQLHIFFKSYQN